MWPLAHEKKKKRVDQNCVCPKYFHLCVGDLKGLNLDISDSLNIIEVELKWESTHRKHQVEYIKLTNLLHTPNKKIYSTLSRKSLSIIVSVVSGLSYYLKKQKTKLLVYGMMWIFCLSLLYKNEWKAEKENAILMIIQVRQRWKLLAMLKAANIWPQLNSHWT